MSITWFDNEISTENMPVAHAHDPGLLVGDGVFETLAVYEKRPFALQMHLERLHRSTIALGLGTLDLQQVRDAIGTVLKHSDLTDHEVGRLRITVWRTAPNFGSPLGDTSCTYSVTLGATQAPRLGTPNQSHARLATSKFRRNEHSAIKGHKSTSYAENSYALRLAQSDGATEAVFFSTSGELSEGSMSNIVVAMDNELLTPPLSTGCLPGITRELALDWGTAAGLPIREAQPGELTNSCVGSSAAILGTLRNVQIASAWDGIPLAENSLLNDLAHIFAAQSIAFHASSEV